MEKVEASISNTQNELQSLLSIEKLRESDQNEVALPAKEEPVAAIDELQNPADVLRLQHELRDAHEHISLLEKMLKLQTSKKELTGAKQQATSQPNGSGAVTQTYWDSIMTTELLELSAPPPCFMPEHQVSNQVPPSYRQYVESILTKLRIQELEIARLKKVASDRENQCARVEESRVFFQQNATQHIERQRKQLQSSVRRIQYLTQVRSQLTKINLQSKQRIERLERLLLRDNKGLSTERIKNSETHNVGNKLDVEPLLVVDSIAKSEENDRHTKLETIKQTAPSTSFEENPQVAAKTRELQQKFIRFETCDCKKPMTAIWGKY